MGRATAVFVGGKLKDAIVIGGGIREPLPLLERKVETEGILGVVIEKKLGAVTAAHLRKLTARVDAARDDHFAGGADVGEVMAARWRDQKTDASGVGRDVVEPARGKIGLPVVTLNEQGAVVFCGDHSMCGAQIKPRLESHLFAWH